MIPLSSVHRDHNTRQILALDGGGIRGIVSSKILAAFLAQMGGLQINEVFELVAGTSTGSLVAAACLIPDPKNPTHPQYSASKVVNIMVEQGPSVFHQSFLREVGTVYGLLEPKYSSKGLLSVINSLGDAKFQNLLTETWFPATDYNDNTPFHFTRRDARQKPDWNNLTLAQVLASTTAAPYYFSANDLTIGKTEYAFLDGGLFANNPVANAIGEAKSIYGCSDNQLCLSIGTGYKIYNNNPKKSVNQGLAKVIGWVTATAIDVTEKNCLKLAEESLGNNLFRFDPILTNDSLDDVSPKNIAYLQEATDTYLEANHQALEDAAKSFKELAPGEKPGAPLECYS